MEIPSLFSSLQGGSLASLSQYAQDKQGEQEGKSGNVSSYSVQSDRVSISQEAIQLAKSAHGGQEQGENESAGSGGYSSGGGSSSADNESKVQELQGRLQELQGKLAASMLQGGEGDAGAIQGQITALMAQIAALR
jgi:hypothetical protein